MNCADCRDDMVARLEGLLDSEQSRQCRAHFESCAACRTEYTAIARLQERLVARGRVAEVSLVEPVMRRIRQTQTKPERTTIMSTLLKYRWGFGLGAAASAAVIILIFALATPRAQAKAAEVLARGARAVAKLTSIHLRGQLRTLPADNFSYINPDQAFYPVELWKQFEPAFKWRAEKPGRVALMDGQSAVLYIKTAHLGNKFPHPSASAFDTEWLHRIANLSNAITNEIKNAATRGWKLSVAKERGRDGRAKAVVTVEAKSGVPDNDYLKNSFIENADTRRVYRFDDQTELLEAVQVYLVRPSGEVLLFDLDQIDYNQPIDPSVWRLDLPADVTWSQPPQKLPDNEKYASMTAEQAARAFFEACARKDWDEAGKFQSVNERMKESLSGLEILSLGESFTSKTYGGRFVPYEIKLRGREFNLRLSNSNAVRRYTITGLFDSKMRLEQDLKWPSEPEVLPNNDAYAKLSPAQAAAAYYDAMSKMDWDEMKKFAPAYDVENDKRQAEMAKKVGIDLSKQLLGLKVGDAFWSAEQSAWFVKCHMSGSVKKHNLALRKDNAAGRWQVDGGI